MTENSEKSFASTDTQESVIENDIKRYQRKGYGLIFAALISIISFAIIPQLQYYQFTIYQGFSSTAIIILIMLPAHYVPYLAGNLLMYFIYMAKHPFFERYRIRQNPWPWDADPIAWKQKFREVVINWLVNSSVGTLMLIIDANTDPSNRTDLDSYPSYLEIIWQVLFFMCVEDTCFYWSHRLLHHKSLYPYIHKKHHEFYTTISCSAEYVHIIEYVFANVIPTTIGFKILGRHAHIATAQFFLMMRLMETIDGHCGYEFSWSPYRLLPFSGSAEYHNYHHSHNVGNYESFFSFWDTICGTNKSYRKHIKDIENRQKIQLLRESYDKKNQ